MLFGVIIRWVSGGRLCRVSGRVRLRMMMFLCFGLRSLWLCGLILWLLIILWKGVSDGWDCECVYA